eukprot:Selendium_serpulae@DN6511_c4_g1_i13.p1
MMNIYFAEQQLSAIVKPQKNLILQRPTKNEHGWPGHRLRQPSLVCRSTANDTVSVDSQSVFLIVQLHRMNSNSWHADFAAGANRAGTVAENTGELESSFIALVVAVGVPVCYSVLVLIMGFLIFITVCLSHNHPAWLMFMFEKLHIESFVISYISKCSVIP